MPQVPVLHVVASAAPPLLDLPHALRLIRAWGWDPYVTLTPTAARWLSDDLGELTAAAGHPPRDADRLPGTDSPFPTPAAVLAAPLTFNSLNKWTAGISDNPALGTLNESLGARRPIVAAPCFNPDLAAHPRYPSSAALLKRAGVRLILTAEGSPLPPSGPTWWDQVLRELPTPH